MRNYFVMHTYNFFDLGKQFVCMNRAVFDRIFCEHISNAIIPNIFRQKSRCYV